MEPKNKRKDRLFILLGKLGASLLGNITAGKGINKSGYGNKKRKEIIAASYGSKLNFYYPLIIWITFKYKVIIRIN